MVKKYVFVRMPVETYNRYLDIQKKMRIDLRSMTGRDIKLPMTKVFKAVASPQFNENFIQIDLRKLNDFVKRRK